MKFYIFSIDCRFPYGVYSLVMGLRKEFQKRIEKKQQEIDNLKSQIREAEIYLQALQDSVKILPKEPNDDLSSQRVLRPTSKLRRARDAIKLAGKPLHISELLHAMGIENNKKNRLSLSGSLASYARRNEIFNRPEPNTFGLIELGHASSHEPPPGFGLQESDLTEQQTLETEDSHELADDDVPF